MQHVGKLQLRTALTHVPTLKQNGTKLIREEEANMYDLKLSAVL